MRKGKDSLTFWLIVGALVICVAVAKNNGNAEAKDSVDIVYPDYYAKNDDTEAETTEAAETEEAQSVSEEEAVLIEDSVIPLADAVSDTAASTAKTAKAAATKKSSAAATAPSTAAGLLERKSQLLSDMAQSSVVADGVQTLANAVITAKTVKYQTLANAAAVSAVNLHNQHHAEALNLIAAQQKAKTDRVNRVITTVGDTTEDILDTAITIQQNKNQLREDIQKDIQQKADDLDKIQSDIHSDVQKAQEDINKTLDDISQTQKEINDKLDDLSHLPQLTD